MATVVKLHVYPKSFDPLCFKDHHRRRSLRLGFRWSSSRRILGGHDGFSLKQCRAFQTEEAGDLEEKQLESEGKLRNLKKNEANLNRENGFWGSVKSLMLRAFNAGSKSDDEYRRAVAKVEKVLHSVSSFK